jgi:signal transduction histidine kinase
VVAAGAAFIVTQALVVAVVDRHLEARAEGEAARMREHIAELEATEQALKRTSEELSAALQAAQAASTSKSAFLASMSHELRTPLNAVLGFSEAMQQEIFGPLGSARYKEYLGNIHDSGSHLLSLINDILDIARYDAGQGELQEELFDPARLISDTIAMMSAQASKAQVALMGDIASDLPCLKGDKRRIRQVLLNLVSNALKFTPPGGKVTAHAFRDERGFVLQVTDTGIGIAHSDFHKVLEPFGQVDSSLARKYDGIGLGLPLTRQMVELHGGSLDLDSMVGHGTTVTIILPASRLMARAEAAA